LYKPFFNSLITNDVFINYENFNFEEINKFMKENLLYCIFNDFIECREYLKVNESLAYFFIQNSFKINDFENIFSIFSIFNEINYKYYEILELGDNLNFDNNKFSINCKFLPKLSFIEWYQYFFQHLSLIYIFINCSGLIIHCFVRFKIKKFPDAIQLFSNAIDHLYNLLIFTLKLHINEEKNFPFTLEKYVNFLTSFCYKLKFKYTNRQPSYIIKHISKNYSQCNLSFIELSFNYFSTNNFLFNTELITFLEEVREYKNNFNNKLKNIRNKSPLSHGLYSVNLKNKGIIIGNKFFKDYLDHFIEIIPNQLIILNNKIIRSLLFIPIYFSHLKNYEIDKLYEFIYSCYSFLNLIEELFEKINEKFGSFSDFLTNFAKLVNIIQRFELIE